MSGRRSKIKMKNPEFILKHRSCLVKRVSRQHPTKNLNDKNALTRALQHLSRLRKNKLPEGAKEICRGDYMTESRVDSQVKLRCRQLPNVVHELRKAIIRQDWDETATLLMILCHPGLKLYSTIILKTCFLLLFHHPNSSLELLQNFIRLTTGYLLEEDVNKFIRILFALRKCALRPLESGKYIRRTGDYKVTRDPEFNEL